MGPFDFAQREHEKPSRNWHNQCGVFTRTAFGAPAIGDFDGDGAADAEDMWKAAKFKHPETDPTKIPRGVPVFWSGGSADNGHAAVSRGGGSMWSTDIVRDGQVDVAPIDLVRQKWGMTLLGWSEDINGRRVFTPPTPEPTPVPTPEPAPKPVRPTLFSVAVCNTMAGSDASAAKGASILRKTLEAYPKAVLVGVVEASNLLDANGVWKPERDTRDLAMQQEGPLDRAGVAFVYDKNRVEVLSVKYRLGARPFIHGKRISMRNRHVLSAKVRIDGHRRKRRFDFEHLPPPRFKELWEPMARLIPSTGAQLGDFNKPPKVVAAFTGKRVRMSGVLGGLFPTWWRIGKARSVDVGADHDAVAITVHHRMRQRQK